MRGLEVIHRGETVSWAITVKRKTPALDISQPGVSLVFTATPESGDGASLSYSIGDGITVVDATSATMVFPSSDTAALEKGAMACKLTLTEPDGRVTVLEEWGLPVR